MSQLLSPARYTSAALVALLAISCAQDRLRYHRELFPVDLPVTLDGQEWLACRVVDGITGSPLGGAELLLVRESKTPLAGEFWFTRRATSDANGFVRVRTDDIKDQWNWIVLRAPGYGAAACMGISDVVWPLLPGQDVPVRVRDWQGRPVGGALISFCGGCGHTPDLQHATSGAEGLALLRGIDPHHHIADLYAQHATLDLGYDSFTWFPGDPPVEFACGPSVAIAGRLVDHRGAPIAGAFVGTQEVHRGPWAKTGTDGSFRLLGGKLGTSPAAVLPKRKIYFERPHSFPAVFRAPAPDPDGHRVQEGTVEPARQKDSREAPPFTTEIRLLPNGAAEEPRVMLRWFGPSGHGSDQVASSGRVEVPTDGPFCFVLIDGQTRRYFPFANSTALPAGVLELPWFKPTTVEGTVVDAAGQPVAVRARVVRWTRGSSCVDPDPEAMVRCPDGRLRLPAEHAGLSLLHLQPEGTELRPRLVFVNLPARGDDVRAPVGRVTLSATPLLRVLGADGRPLTEAAVRFYRAGLHRADRAPDFAVDANGGWLGPDPSAGDAIVVTAAAPEDRKTEAVVPFRTVLGGEGPWTIHLPATSVTVQVADVAGKPLAAVVFIADHSVDVGDDGRIRLLHLPPGDQKLFVAAAGHQTAEVTVTVKENGSSECRVVLPTR